MSENIKYQTEARNCIKMSPDGYSRYFIVIETLKKIFQNTPAKILDVGGKGSWNYDFLITQKLPYQLTVADIQPCDEEEKNKYEYIRINGTKLPFSDNFFDAVVTTDVLEHVPDQNKEKFITELIRTAKKTIILAAPCDSPETEKAELLANNFYKKYFGKDHKWLKEHFQLHKPDQRVIERIINKKKLDYISFESGNLENWILTILPNFFDSECQNLNYFFNKNILEMNDFAKPGYRQFYIIFKDPKIKIKNSFEIFGNISTNYNKIFIWKTKMIDHLCARIRKIEEINNEKDRQLQKIYCSNWWKINWALKNPQKLMKKYFSK